MGRFEIHCAGPICYTVFLKTGLFQWNLADAVFENGGKTV
jgi:hypothetical protein